MRNGFHWTAAVLAALVPACASSAALLPDAVSGVTAVAFNDGDGAADGTGNGGTLNVVNGSGLTLGATNADATHSTGWQQGWQGAASSGWFVADLQSVRADLSDMYIWNVKEGVGGSGTQETRGANAIEVFYSTSPTVAPAMNTAYDFGSGGWTSLTTTNLPMATTTGLDATLSLTPINTNGGARYIGIRMDSNHGGTSPARVGFAEIQFTAIPEPASLALVGPAVAMLLGRRRRC